jgi:hypothetical protein
MLFNFLTVLYSLPILSEINFKSLFHEISIIVLLVVYLLSSISSIFFLSIFEFSFSVTSQDVADIIRAQINRYAFPGGLQKIL